MLDQANSAMLTQALEEAADKSLEMSMPQGFHLLLLPMPFDVYLLSPSLVDVSGDLSTEVHSLKASLLDSERKNSQNQVLLFHSQFSLIITE